MAPWNGITFSDAQDGVTVGRNNYESSDGSKIYYEVSEANADVSINVLYETVADVSGLGEYHAVIEIAASSLDLSGLFEIKVDGNDLDNNDTTDLRFKVHSDTKTIDNAFGVLSDKTVSIGNYQATDSKFSKDFVRHMAYKITGGYASADIFANEAELVADVSRAIFAAVNTLETEWKDLSENEWIDSTTADNILVTLAEKKFKNELKKATAEMSGAGAASLYDYVGGSNETFPILSKLLLDAQDTTDISAEAYFGFGEDRLQNDGSDQTESLVFHINVEVASGVLPDGRSLTGIIPDVRTYKVVLNLS